MCAQLLTTSRTNRHYRSASLLHSRRLSLRHKSLLVRLLHWHPAFRLRTIHNLRGDSSD